MENERKNNKTVIVAIAALAIIGIVAGTYAYFTSSARVDNTFTAASYTTEVQRTLMDSTKLLPGDTINVEELKVANKGERNISVRAKVSESIVSAGDPTATPTAVEGTPLALNLTTNSTTASSYDNADAIRKTLGSGWVDGGDGYFYYTSVVAPESATQNLFTTLVINPDLKNLGSCAYSTSGEGSYTDTDAGQAADDAANDVEPRHSGNVTCTSSTSAGYAKSVYTLKVQFDTIQSSAASTWNNNKAATENPANLTNGGVGTPAS